MDEKWVSPFGTSYPLFQHHDESIIDRRRTIEESHPVYIGYARSVKEAWEDYQTKLEEAKTNRDAALPHDVFIEMIQGKRKMGLK